MVTECTVCGFQAKTMQGLAGHKRMAHTQATGGPQQQANQPLPDRAVPQSRQEYCPPTTSEPSRLEKLEEEVWLLGNRITGWGVHITNLTKTVEINASEARSREAGNQVQSVSQPFIPYLRSSSVPVEERISALADKQSKLESALADKQSKLEKEHIELANRLRRVEEATEANKAMIKLQALPIKIEPKFPLCSHSIKQGHHP